MISTAWAQDAVTGAAQAPAWGAAVFSYLPLILIFGVFYFLVIRPQNKAAAAREAMMAALKTGDTVLTSGGLVVKLTKVKDKATLLEGKLVPSDTAITIARAAVEDLVDLKKLQG